MLLARDTLPETIVDIAALDELLCRPSQALIDDLARVGGDVMILGVGGKMGPTLAGLAKAALPEQRIIGVASRPFIATCSTKWKSAACRKFPTSFSWPGASSGPRAIWR